jgi:hypothetical protein
VQTIAKPRKEKEVLKPVSKDAKAEEIRKSIVAQAQCCVQHLCGCSSAQGC